MVAVIELEWLRGGTGPRLQPLSHPRGPQVYNIWFPQLERLVAGRVKAGEDLNWGFTELPYLVQTSVG